MANVDDPHGFLWVENLKSQKPTIFYAKLAGTVAKGDTLVNGGSGTFTIGLSNSGQIAGVAGEAGVSGETIMAYAATEDDVFEGQCSGTYAATMDYTDVDIEGTTGIQEVNEDATTEKVFRILGYNTNDSIGANTRVRGIFRLSGFTGLEDAET